MLTAALGFLGVYILMPIALIIRDQLIIMYIEKVILTAKFWHELRVLTIDKAYFNTIYTKKYEVRVPVNDEVGNKYYIDDVEVSLDAFNHFCTNQKMHVDRIAMMEPKALAKANLLKWISKHFKMDADFVKTIDGFIKNVYDFNVSEIKNKKQDLIVSDINPPSDNQKAETNI
jgi:hypothetical protein